MKAIFSLLFLIFLLSENAQSQVILLDSPAEATQLSQGANIALDIRSITVVEYLQVELWLREEMVDFIVLPPGTLNYNWQLPKHKAAKHYQIRIVNQKDGSLLAKSERFTIGKAKSVLVSKIVTIATVPISLLGSWAVVTKWDVLEAPDPIR
ncbi:MAG: hypothetical protein AB8H47_02395 [Bacteroidia bacterium]